MTTSAARPFVGVNSASPLAQAPHVTQPLRRRSCRRVGVLRDRAQLDRDRVGQQGLNEVRDMHVPHVAGETEDLKVPRA